MSNARAPIANVVCEDGRLAWRGSRGSLQPGSFSPGVQGSGTSIEASAVCESSALVLLGLGAWFSVAAAADVVVFVVVPVSVAVDAAAAAAVAVAVVAAAAIAVAVVAATVA
eukprot:1847237-Alexandrium_andersonii.AAC.1